MVAGFLMQQTKTGGSTVARFPGALWKPITVNKGRQRLTVTNRVNLHVAVSEAQSLQPYFNQRGIADSHFYVRKSGVIEQMVDTAWRANADLEANDATISIETQGGLHNSEKEKWTPAQLRSLAAIYAWAVKTHGIKLRLATSSKLGSSSQGLSWHRLGCNGNFPRVGILRGRQQRGGGMLYSRAFGKTCPGSAKIRQIPTVLSMAAKLLVSGGGTSVPSKPKPSKPKPKPAAKKRKPKRLPILSRGKRRGSYWVGLWQRFLNSRGYALAVDKIFGNGTHTATVAWQKSVGLEGDGVVGILSWTRAVLGVRPGQRAPSTEIWQRMCGLTGRHADGIFGRTTTRRSQEVQRWLKVAADAVIGSNTISNYRKKV